MNQKGTTLLEVVIAIAIFTLAALSIYSMVLSAFNFIKSARARVVATYVANERMEIIRNLSYNNVATDIGWVPPGPIPSSVNVIKDGLNFTVNTDITYVDDPFDGTASGSPADTFPWDYKKVRIKVSWSSGPMIGGPAVLVTTVAPKGLEGLSPGKGAINVKVSDAAGLKVPGVDVAVQNNSILPVYSLNTTTDSNGNLYITNLTPYIEGYKISVSKSGYSAERTYSAADLAAMGYNNNPVPAKPYASVIAGEVTPVTFRIDRVSTLGISSVKRNSVQNLRINTGLNNNNQDNASFALDGSNNVYFTWRDDSSSTKIYAQKYNTNWTPAWNPDPRLTSAGNGSTSVIRVGNTSDFYVAWGDDRNGNPDVYLERFKRSDASEVWSGPVKVNSDSGSADQVEPDFALDAGDNSYVVWADHRNGDYDIYAQKINSGGSKIWASDLMINDNAVGANQRKPKIALYGDHFYATWLDNRSGIDNIYAQKYDLNGNRLWASDLRVSAFSPVAAHYSPSLAVDASDNVFFVWADDRDGNKDIYLQKYDSSGNVLWASGDVKLNTDYNTAQDEPSIYLDYANSFAYVSWTDNRNGNEDIYFNKYTFSTGSKFWEKDIRVNTDSGTAIQKSSHIALTTAGEVIVAWQDQRSGNWDVYATKISGAFSYVTVGSFGVKITGNKSLGTYIDGLGNTVPIPKYSKNKNISTGGTLGLPDASDPYTELEWDSYQIQATNTYNIVDTDPSLPIYVDAGSNKAITIIVE